MAASSPASAQDMGYALYGLQLRAFVVQPGERALVFGGSAERPVTVTAFGEHIVYLDGYDKTRKNRLWRSLPLPFGACMADLRLDIRTAAGAVIVRATGCAAPVVWVRFEDGVLAGFDPVKPANVDVMFDGAKPDLTVVEGRLRELWTRRKSWSDEGDAASPAVFGFHVVGLPPAQALGVAIDAAAVKKAAGGFVPLLTQIDWREANLTVRQLNDAAFMLQRTGRCADSHDAVLMLHDVLRRDPARGVAHLNLGDAYAIMGAPECKTQNMGGAGLLAVEEYRLYCTAIGPAVVPAFTAARLAKALGVARLTAETCRPIYAMFRAIDAADAAGFKAALADEAFEIDAVGPEGYTPLGAALKAGQGGFARALIDAHANVETSGESAIYGNTPLITAIARYDVHTVQALLKAGAETHYYGERSNPLPYAAGLRANPATDAAKLDIMRTLIDTKAADYNGTGSDTALYAAAGAYGPVEAIALLLKSGAAINKPSQYGRTPIFAIAPFAGHDAGAILRALLEAGANPNQQDQSGSTPLVYLFAWGHADQAVQAEMVRVLVEHGADPNLAKADDGSTALELAAMQAMPDTMAYLLAHGARVPVARDERTILTRVRARITERSRKGDDDCGCLPDYRRVEGLLVKAGAQ